MRKVKKYASCAYREGKRIALFRPSFLVSASLSYWHWSIYLIFLGFEFWWFGSHRAALTCGCRLLECVYVCSNQQTQIYPHTCIRCTLPHSSFGFQSRFFIQRRL